ncbi:UNVERIFIED_ORG: hypothetical protein FHR68_003703 [Xanthomonas campestris]
MILSNSITPADTNHPIRETAHKIPCPHLAASTLAPSPRLFLPPVRAAIMTAPSMRSTRRLAAAARPSSAKAKSMADICTAPLLTTIQKREVEFGLRKKEPRVRGSCVSGLEASVAAPSADGGRRCSDHLAGTFCDDPSFQANA